MNSAIITDQHLDGRKSSQAFWEFFMKFYNDVFFPTLEKNNIKVLFDLGDTFDNRKSIDFAAWSRIKTEYYDRLQELGIEVHMIVGNHTAYYKNTNRINTPSLLLDSYDNIRIYDEVCDIEVLGNTITMVPWINSENQAKVMDHLTNTKSQVLMGHLEINGFEAHPGHVFEGGLERSIFSKFPQVFSGHFHHKSRADNIYYLGNPYEMTWSDFNEERGFHLYDLDSRKIKFFRNPYRMFKKFYYDDEKNNYMYTDLSDYKDCYVKVIVENKTDSYMFDKVIEKFYSVGIHDLKIIEDNSMFDSDDDSVENLEHEDTLSTLQRYIEEMKDNYDKSNLKSIIKSIYIEACEIQ
jgi:DNA repair exonuclease SbcCD nuclease subunit